MSSAANWPVDDIDDVLAADFDGSLSGLGMELGTASFQMSDALMALPHVSSLKQEKLKENGDASRSAECHLPSAEPSRSTSAALNKKTRLSQNADEEVSGAIKRFCVSSDRGDGDNYQNPRCRHSSSVPDLRATGSQPATPVAILSASMLSQMLHISDSPPPGSTREISPTLRNVGFQYVLGAATSIATKITEESMTYLNQGQPYEIKLKKLGDLTEMRGKMLKSIIRVGFQERRLQYMEKEQISQWQQERIGERILSIDVPLSYGVYDVFNDPNSIHLCEFLWDPTKETGVFVKVNCISTEFTPKKHGGEKGVPFRIQIETFSHNEDYSERLHVASCQVKVFKPKGADRKHKTDKEKMSRRPLSEQDQFRSSCDCTVFVECNPDSLYISPLTIADTSTTPTKCQNFSPQGYSSENSNALPSNRNLSSSCATNDSTNPIDSTNHVVTTNRVKSPSPNHEVEKVKLLSYPIKEEFSLSFNTNSTSKNTKNFLSSETSASETAQWLQQNRFGNFVKIFSNYSGADLLTLSRVELIQICGLADGIRLYNVLHSRSVRPRLIVYVCLETEPDADIPVFRAIYLENLTISELKSKLASLLNLPSNSLYDTYVIGPSAIRVIVTDEVLQNMSEESMFVIEMLKDSSKDSYGILLRPYVQK